MCKESYISVSAGLVNQCAAIKKDFLEKCHSEEREKTFEEHMERENYKRSLFPWKWFFNKLTYEEAKEHYLDKCSFYDRHVLSLSKPDSLQYDRCVELLAVSSKLPGNKEICLSISDCIMIGYKEDEQGT